jgi:hypothetical protein
MMSYWKYFGEVRDITECFNNCERSTSAGVEAEPIATITDTAAVVVVTVGPQDQELSVNCCGGYGKVDWESSLDEDEDDNGAENERDKSLGASAELPELLALERDNPDDFDFLNPDVPCPEDSSEVPTGNVPPTLSTINSPGLNESREKLPVTLGTVTVLPSIEEDGYDDDYEYDYGDDDEDEFPADEFVKTQAFVTKAESRLRKILPYKQYRVRRPSLLRSCYTVIA